MLESGTVLAFSPNTKMFIVSLIGAEYAVFKLLGPLDLQIGDSIKGELAAKGRKTLVHVAHRRSFEAAGMSGPTTLQACQRFVTTHR